MTRKDIEQYILNDLHNNNNEIKFKYDYCKLGDRDLKGYITLFCRVMYSLILLDSSSFVLVYTSQKDYH